ncbi:unnamed protein product [Caenorhabditis auriculariae]|uniref:Uncharacterized protein n=1 Tax=Caenorhabditis auriculariae TaxID=2777116 RepID=A0A8S1HJI1_9PELO|nr:unnamed protein product [Caenorhabditis auriculariae]
MKTSTNHEHHNDTSDILHHISVVQVGVEDLGTKLTIGFAATGVVIGLLLLILLIQCCDRYKKTKQQKVPSAIVIQPNSGITAEPKKSEASEKSVKCPGKKQSDLLSLPSKNMKVKVHITADTKEEIPESSNSSKKPKKKSDILPLSANSKLERKNYDYPYLPSKDSGIPDKEKEVVDSKEPPSSEYADVPSQKSDKTTKSKSTAVPETRIKSKTASPANNTSGSTSFTMAASTPVCLRALKTKQPSEVQNFVPDVRNNIPGKTPASTPVINNATTTPLSTPQKVATLTPSPAPPFDRQSMLDRTGGAIPLRFERIFTLKLLSLTCRYKFFKTSHLQWPTGSWV